MKRALPHGKFLVAIVVMVIAVFMPVALAATDPYLKIAEGDSRARVIGLLGEPADPRKDLTPAERKNIRETLNITENKESVDFAVWKQSSHLYYLVGFNKKGAVATKRRIIGLAVPK